MIICGYGEVIMKGSNQKPTLSLYRHFSPGDRVKRNIRNNSEGNHMMEGIIMAMDHDRLEIYWDKIDGIYCPNDIDDDFTKCDFEEVMFGTDRFTPVKQKKPSII